MNQTKIKELSLQFSKYSRSSLEQRLAQELLDWAETDTYVRKACKGVLSEKEIQGDNFGVPALEDLVDKLIQKIQFLTNDSLKSPPLADKQYKAEQFQLL